MAGSTSSSSVIISGEMIEFCGEALEELRPYHLFFSRVLEAVQDYRNEVRWYGNTLPGEDAVFEAGEEFSRALLRILEESSNISAVGEGAKGLQEIMSYLSSIWPPDVALAFNCETGVLDLTEI